MKIEVGGVTFASKAALRRHCQGLTARYKHRGKVKGADDTFLRALLPRHPHAIEKAGVGVAHFTVENMPPFFKSKGLMLHRADGSVIDFSYYACIDGDTPWIDFCKAARYAVADQITDFRAGEFGRGGQRCPIHGTRLTPSTSHVDHCSPTFLELVNGFLAGDDWAGVPLTPHPSGAGGYVFTDNDYARRFADYHQKYAVLRLLSPKANLSTTRVTSQVNSQRVAQHR